MGDVLTEISEEILWIIVFIQFIILCILAYKISKIETKLAFLDYKDDRI